MIAVSQLMTRNPTIATVDMTVEACSQLMRDRKIRHLPLVDTQHKLLGMLTDTNVLRHHDSSASLVSLSVPIGTVTPVDRASRALHELLRYELEVAVVVDEEERPIGIFTTKDALRLMFENLPDDAPARVIASRPVRAIEPEKPALEALAVLFEKHIRHLLVCTPTQVVGVLAYRDLAFNDVNLLSTATVGQLVATRDVVSAPASYSLKQVVGLMIERGVGCVPLVTEEGGIDGLVTRTDVAIALYKEVRRLEQGPRKSKLVRSGAS